MTEQVRKTSASPCRRPCATCAVPLECAKFRSDKGTRLSVPFYDSHLLETHSPFFSAKLRRICPTYHVILLTPVSGTHCSSSSSLLTPLVQHLMYIQTPPLASFGRLRPLLFGATRGGIAWSQTLAFQGASTCFDV
jgi:hypothetical protein